MQHARALEASAPGSWVQRLDEELQTALETALVTVGATAGGYHEIVSGVAVGEAIVTHGAFLLKSEILRDPTE